jgi:hypothetical protein
MFYFEQEMNIVFDCIRSKTFSALSQEIYGQITLSRRK